MTRLDAPATHRNREPILAILKRWLGADETGSGETGARATSAPDRRRVLEIASGTGQHAVFFAAALPQLDWQPTDVDPAHLASIEVWRAESGLPNVRPPRRLDVRDPDWGIGREGVDAIFNANMIHIAPWPVAEGLLAGAGRTLVEDGLLFVYGPFRIGGRHTAASNEAFDADLRRRDPSFGVRDLEAVVELAARAGLERIEIDAMPANNQLIVFERR